jgi:hypothetical protein
MHAALKVPMDERYQNDGLGSPTGPRFDQTIPRNLTVQEGQTAILSCRVLNLAEKTVSGSKLFVLQN